MCAASCQTVVSGISQRSARIAYNGLFAPSLIVSWILREVAAFLMEKIPAILMIGVKSQKGPRDGVHYGGWMMKSFVGASCVYCLRLVVWQFNNRERVGTSYGAWTLANGKFT
ncbi:hypothetical protein MTR67_028586 [Solanum verrucosum]|uniref:Uncharacterized protein n=1 Tax=Solanum verrucosum TaxID=315347 RepID=A0AAF0RBF9_SOLVR|nr:hypothetical protein MTR67_028586 [Solanum verrucosum]